MLRIPTLVDRISSPRTVTGQFLLAWWIHFRSSPAAGLGGLTNRLNVIILPPNNSIEGSGHNGLGLNRIVCDSLTFLTSPPIQWTTITLAASSATFPCDSLLFSTEIPDPSNQRWQVLLGSMDTGRWFGWLGSHTSITNLAILIHPGVLGFYCSFLWHHDLLWIQEWWFLQRNTINRLQSFGKMLLQLRVSSRNFQPALMVGYGWMKFSQTEILRAAHQFPSPYTFYWDNEK